MFKKTLCATLAALMLVSPLSACGNNNDPDETKSNVQPQDTENVEVDTREQLEIPETRYNGTELCFLTREEGSWSTVEIFSDSKTANSDNISYAVFERNDRIKENYGVTITEYKTDDPHTAVTNEVSAPTGDFMAIISNVTIGSNFATSGYLWNLYSDQIEYISLDKPWWDAKMASGLSIDNRLYFATGDLLTLDNDATFAIMFNKKLATDAQIPDLYTLVDNGEWTMDRLYEFEQKSVRDLNGDGQLAYDSDVCGFAYTQDVPSCMLTAGGITLCVKDENDIPYHNIDVERAQDLSDMCRSLFSKEYTVNLNESGVDVEEAGKKCFGENHALFFGECLQCVTRVRGYDVDFGILPYPKYNADQTSYYSMMHSTAAVVSIPRSVTDDNLVMVNSMIEAMAYHAVDTLTKQYYEINLKTKGAKDVQSGPMIDTILANRACDLAYYYGWGSGAHSSLAACLLPSSTLSISSVSNRYAKQVKNSITSLLRKMEKFD